MRTIAIINQKGGVGKTTTSMNLAHALVLRGKKVTMLDLDPQANLTASLGVTDRNVIGMDKVLLENTQFSEVTIQVRKRLQLVPAGYGLGQMEYQNADQDSNPPTSLRNVLQGDSLNGVFSDQDFVLVDCPPSSGALVINAIHAASELVIPVSADYMALHGLSHLMGTLQSFESSMDHKVKYWIAVTRFQNRRLAAEVREKLIEYFSGKVLATPIREVAAIAESPSIGKTAFEYKGFNYGAQDYFDLARDLLEGRTI